MGMACHGSGGLLATTGADKRVCVWDVDGGFCTYFFRGHQGIVTSIMFHSDPKRLLRRQQWSSDRSLHLMDGDGNCEMWDCTEEAYTLQTDPPDDVSQYLCDEVNQNDYSLLSMLDEQTPIKDCVQLSETCGGSANKGYQEFRESSLQKRRRVLEFSSENTNAISIDFGPSTSNILKSKARDDLLMEDELSQNLRCDSPWNLDFQDDRGSGFEGIEPTADGWLASCFNESQMQCNPAEMNENAPSYDQGNYSESYTVSSEMETDVQNKPPLSRARIYRGKKSFIKAPRKLTTSVVYPFALIKPCGAQGDVTLKDINQRILAPPPSKEKPKEEESLSYPKSAFSGKPVVVKTKIHTEGKGSITIMRTKG